MKNTLKSNKGITLIALVITIIVLLILAGVTIAMLSGENGILSRATETKMNNDYFSADEQVKLAYMAVKTEIMANRAQNGTYTASGDASNLKQIVKKELVKSGSGFEVSEPVASGNDKLIKIKYTNVALKKDGISAGVPAENGHVNYVITLTSKDATLTPNLSDSNFGTFTADTSTGGGSSEEPGTGGNENTPITFYIENIELSGTSGMTWGQWVLSENNQEGFTTDSSGVFIPAGGAKLYVIKIINPGEENEEEIFCQSSDEIIANENYSIKYVVDNITFTINGISYEAEPDMTWENWANSPYNTAGFVYSCDEEWVETMEAYTVTYYLKLNGIRVKDSSDNYIAFGFEPSIAPGDYFLDS